MSRKGRTGVTLLEMLVALAVMAAVAVVLAALFGLLARATSTIEARTGAGTLLADRLILRRWMEEAPAAATLDGRADGFTLTTILDAPFSPAVPTQIVLALSPDGMVKADALQGRTTMMLSLSGNGASLVVDYYGSWPPSDPPAWHALWPAPAGLPDLVRILYADATRPYPVLTVQPAQTERQSEISLSSPLPPD